MPEPKDWKSGWHLLRKIIACAPPDTWLAVDCREGEIIGPDLLQVLNAAKSHGFTSRVLILSPNLAEKQRSKNPRRRLDAGWAQCDHRS